MIRALIFDFDGLILDTEGPIYQSWRELFQKYDCDLRLETWAKIIGVPVGTLDPFTLLEEKLGYPVDRAALSPERRAREDELNARQPVLPGVEAYIAEAKRLGLGLAIASSSSCKWITRHLTRLGLLSHFDCIRASDDVDRAKPDPDLYLSALECLNVEPHQAIALEDSPNGVMAAKRAGLFCVAVPNPLTRELPLDHADLRLDTLAEMPLEELLRKAEAL
ncbi:MAG TPA: HAD family hydrolase [Anaerolineales bacterium]|nr:HAD family hydrolase [Anaerolineales bacterium]